MALNWAAIPTQLQQFSTWALCHAHDKAPHLPITDATGFVTGFRYASTSADQYLSFTDACTIAESNRMHIGLVLRSAYNLVVIDCDIHDGFSLDSLGIPLTQDAWTPQHRCNEFTDLLEFADTYAEVSTNGDGIHIVCAGENAATQKHNHMELFSDNRFVVFTGDTISKGAYFHDNGKTSLNVIERDAKPIVNLQNVIDQISITMRSSQTQRIALVESDAIETDETIWQRASNASNANKFLSLCEGQWQGTYPSQSEADKALLSMFTLYSPSNEQVRRMFRETKLGVRDKANKNNYYLDLTLASIRAREQRERDQQATHNLDAMIASANLRKQNKPVPDNVVNLHSLKNEAMKIVSDQNNAYKEQVIESKQNIKPPPNINGTIDWPIGTLGQIASFIYNSSHRPVKEISIISALGFMAGIAGGAYHTPSQTGLNLYLILIARSAVGKEAINNGLTLIQKHINDKSPLLSDSVLDFAKYQSQPALIKTFVNKKSFLNISGEWGRRLQRSSDDGGKRGDPQEIQLRTALTDIYAKSGPNSTVSGLVYSDSDKDVEDIGRVAYSMIGESTPTTFYDALTPSMMEDGFLSRFNIIRYEGVRPEVNKNPTLIMDTYLIEKLVSMITYSRQLIENRQSVLVAFDDDALKAADEFNQRCDELINAEDEDSIRQAWNRAHLKVIRMASLCAVADNHIKPVVNMEYFNWALNSVCNDTEFMLSKIKSGDVGTGDDARLKKFIAVTLEFFNNEYSKTYKVRHARQMANDGVVPYMYLYKRIAQQSSYRNHQRGAANALGETIKTAISSGLITQLDATQARERYGSTAQCYLLTKSFPQD